MKLIKISLVIFFITALFNNVFADEGIIEIKKTEIIEIQIKYNLDLKGEDFLSSSVLSLLSLRNNFLKNSKEIIWTENFTFSNGESIKRELKINNSERNLFYITKEGGQYFGKIYFEQKKELNKHLVFCLFNLLEFLESDFNLGSEFNFDIINEYRLFGRVDNFKNCLNYQNICPCCQSALILVDIFDNKNKKIINIEADISKDSKTNGKIKSAIIKTLFWPRITAIISLKE